MAGNPPTLPMTQGYDAPYRFLVNRMAFVALGLGVFFSSFNTWRVSEQNITLSDVMFMIAAMMLIAIGRINLSPFRELTVLWFSGLALFMLGLFFSSMLVGILDRWIIVAGQYMFAYLLLPLIFMAQERQHIRSLLKIFIFAAFAIELVGVIVATTLSYAEAHAMLGGEFLAGNGRLGSFAGESNRNALLVASTLPMVAYAMRTRLLPLVLAVPILVMLLWGLVLSASFTGFIGAIGALAIFFVVGGIRPSPKIIALMAAVVAVLYMSGYQLPTVFQDRVANALETGNLDDAGTFTDRAKLISDAWALSEHTIFAGLGVDRFRVWHPSGQPVHNMYLLILTEGGVAALIGWLIIILVLLVLPLPVLRRQRTEGALCYAVLFVFLLFTMASPHMFARFWVVTLMLPLGLILPPVATLNASRSNGRA